MTPGKTPLVVPLNVLALAVNEKDAHDATPHFSGTQTSFTDQLGPNQAFLGANVNRSLVDAPAQPLTAGVHLHWALPDALTKADTDPGGNLLFRAAPNRWLVQRFVIDGGQATRSAWVVLSDWLGDQAPAGQVVITLPTHPTNGMDYQYSGQAQPFSSSWTEPAIPPGKDFATLTGGDLNAVATGQTGFFAFYPNCRGVFGFHDTLTDLGDPPGGSANLLYVVTGWYSDPSRDPLYGGRSLDEVQELFAWSFADPNNDAKPDSSLYSGLVQNVVWHPDETYLPDYSANLPSVALDLSLGNNPPEAMSCYLQATLTPQVPYFQTLLNAFFEGLWGKLQQPLPSILSKLREELHENRFQSIKAEYLYAVVEPGEGTDSDGNPVTVQVDLADQPPAIGDQLNLLNLYAQAMQLIQEGIANANWQLFADWYRIFMSKPAGQQTAYDVAYAQYQAVQGQGQALSDANAKLQAQYDKVVAMLPPGCSLEQVPAPRFWQPSDPVFLLGGSALPPMNRYGCNGQYDADGYLICRLPGQVVTAAAADGVTVTAQDFSSLAWPTPNALPAPDVFNQLLIEGLLLDTTVLSSRTGKAISYAELIAAVSGDPSPLALTGTAPSQVALSGWAGNPWVPMFAAWKVSFQPVFATCDSTQSKLLDYPADFFTSQFTIDPDLASIGYSPAQSPAGGDFWQVYQGSSILSTSAINGFAQELTGATDPVMQKCLAAIEAVPMVMQSLSGLTNAFLMQDESLQLNIQVPESSEYYYFTQAVAQTLGGYANIAPSFNGYYNPARAGFFKLELMLVDIFGQKLAVTPQTTNVAQSLTAKYQDQPVPGIAYLPPRLSQASRLLFRFLASDAMGLTEMNQHPATTPICGWFLPDHLNGSLFVYDMMGASLGSLYLDDAHNRILWQSAPGNDATIDQTVEQVMEDQQPQLRDLVVALSQAQPAFFADFMSAIDNVNGFVEPQDLSTNNDLAVLIGRPMAVVQVALTLELMGTPQFNQSWSVLGLDPTSNPLAETDNGLSEIEFPVILGDLTNLDDGLIGYFKRDQGAYQFGSFYSMGADAQGRSGVQQPVESTVSLTAFPGAKGGALDDKTERLLVLMDPRAALHATTGILPTTQLQIPSNMYADTLSTLEMTFLTIPILGGSSALQVPLPAEAGFQWSWIQDKIIDIKRRWQTRGDLLSSMPTGMWTYTPQTILDGWLRLNPELLAFDLQNAQQKAIVVQGENDGLTLTITNRQGRAITFLAGVPVAEGAATAGSVFYLHFGTAVPQEDVSKISLRADGWAFACFTDAQYGSYWAASPVADTNLAGSASLLVHVDGVQIATDKQQIMIFTDYYQVGQLNDGVYQDVLSVAQR